MAQQTEIIITYFYYLSNEFRLILIPGPIVLEIEMFLTKSPFTVDGFSFKIVETTINNLLGKKNNTYKVIQYFDCKEYNKEIVKVI